MEGLTVVIILAILVTILVVAACTLFYNQSVKEAEIRATLDKLAQLTQEQKAVEKVIVNRSNSKPVPVRQAATLTPKANKGTPQHVLDNANRVHSFTRTRSSDSHQDVHSIITANMLDAGVYMDSSPVYDTPTPTPTYSTYSAPEAPSRSYDSCSSSDYNRSSSYSSSSSDYSSSSSSSSSDSSSCSSSSFD